MTYQFLGVCMRDGFLQYTSCHFHASNVIPFKPFESMWRFTGGMVLMTRRSQRRSSRVLGYLSISKSYLEKCHLLEPHRSAIPTSINISIHGQITVLRIGFISPRTGARMSLGMSPPAFAGSRCVHGLEPVNVQNKPQGCCYPTYRVLRERKTANCYAHSTNSP